MKGNAWNPENWIAIGITALYCALGYLGTVIALRSNRQEFSLIIPYVRFRNDGEVRQSMVVDMETLIDGRLPMLFQTGFLEGTLTVQQETVEQLGQLAEQPDPLSRERGRRGLEGLETLKKLPQLEVSVHQEWHTQETTPEQRLVELAKILDARLLTTDGNLARMAQIQGVPAMNLSALAEGLRPTYSVGDNLNLTLTKEGKDDHQAVGYTPEGLMIVVNQARKRIGSTVAVTVSSTVQTTGGRLIFAELSKPKV